MKHGGMVCRPPVEAGTFLIPVTEGCTHNSCTFCNMYQGVRFRMLAPGEIEKYLRAAGVNDLYLGVECG